MSTRSITILKESDGKEIAVLYRQCDGYPKGHGQELANFLKEITVVNGMTLQEQSHIANGFDCLAAQIVAHFKFPRIVSDYSQGKFRKKKATRPTPGQFYLYPAGTRDCGEEWVYVVGAQPENKGAILLTVEKPQGAKLWAGSPAEFDAAAIG